MRDYTQIYIDGAWVVSADGEAIDVINPATEQPAGQIALGSQPIYSARDETSDPLPTPFIRAHHVDRK